MKNVCLVAGIALLLGLIISRNGLAEDQILERKLSRVGHRYVPGEIIVKFKRGVGEDVVANINSRHGASVSYTSRFAGFRRLRVPRKKKLSEMLETYRKNPNVEYAELNYIAYAFWMPNDTYYSYQWHLDNSEYGGINMQQAWDITAGDPSVVVAVVDTGVAYENYTETIRRRTKRYYLAPDLAGTYFVQGTDFVNNDDHANDDEGHGTHVTGTIAQTTHNQMGVAGVAFNCSIMPVKVLDRYGSGTYADVADGIIFAADNGAHVINLSLGGASPSTTLENACAYAYESGVTIVCASGNDGAATISYPAAYDAYCIAVGATRYDETMPYYSNYGDSLDLVAPGGDLSVDQNGDGYADGVLQQTFGYNTNDWGYWFYEGTSMATPHVAAVAALLISSEVALTPDEVREALQSTAEDLGEEGWDETYGWGLVDAYAALQWTSGPPAELVSIAVTPQTTSIPKGLTQQYTATGTYLDDSTADITADVTWESFNTLVATIDSSGLATAAGEGFTAITAALDGVEGSAELTVTAPVLVSIAVTPETASIEIGSTQQYAATGTYSDDSTADITESVTWASTNSSIATIDSFGSATGLADGTTIITASLDALTSNEAQLAVTPPPPTLESIEVTPADTSIPVGSTQQYTATGTYSDDSTVDITADAAWESTNTSTATIDSSGLATAEAEGTTIITATLGGVQGSATLTVTEAPSEVTVFSDGFESSADWSANWSQDSQNDWRRRTSRAKEGRYAAEVDGRATDAQLISIPIDLQGKTNATVTFWWYIERGLDTGEYLAFDVSVDGGANWAERARLSGNVDQENTWHNVSIGLSSINSLRIRFRGTMNRSSEDAYVDVVEVIAE